MPKVKKKKQQKEKLFRSSKKKYCLDALQIFKHWNDRQRKSVIDFYYKIHGASLKTDENAVLMKIHEAIDRTSEEQRKKGKNPYDFSDINPGYLYTICTQLFAVDDEGKRKKEGIRGLVDTNVDVDELNDAIEGLSVEIKNFDKKTSEEKIGELLDRYREKLTKAGYEILVKLASAALDESKHGKIVIDEVAKQHGLKPNTFTKNISRLREQVKEPEMREMLSLVLKEEISAVQKLRVYRFSIEELKKLISMKELFEKNGFSIERFPEVYYDTYDRYCDAYGCKKKKEDSNYDWLADMHPDKLGVYHYPLIEADYHLSGEGVIILFSDRIEKFCKQKNIDQSHVRLIVLMHELGHWLSHWPLAARKRYAHERLINRTKMLDIRNNWCYGYDWNYSKGNIKTHEILAQLIAYWSIKDEAKLTNILLNDLSPKNPNDPYSLYKLFLEKSESEIFCKIPDLRLHFFLSDELACEYLSGSDKNMKTFYAKKQDGLSPESLGLNRIMEICDLSSNKQSDFFSKLHLAYKEFGESVEKQVEDFFKSKDNPFTLTRGADLEKDLFGM